MRDRCLWSLRLSGDWISSVNTEMRKNILILGCKNYPAFSSKKIICGGMEIYAEELVKHLKKHYDITIISGGFKTKKDDDGVNVINVPLFGGAALQPVALLFFSFVHSFRLAGKTDLINAQSPLSGLIGFFFKKMFGIPYVVSVHISVSNKRYTGNGLIAAIYNFLEKMVLRGADKIICAGYNLRDELISKYGFEEGRIVVIHPGAGGIEKSEDDDNGELTEFFDMDNFFKLLFLGRLIKGKGLMELLEAMKHLRDKPIKLFLAGEGDLSAALKRYVKKNKLADKVKFIGMVNGKRKEELLKRVDLLISASHYEVFPVAYLEAISFGLPVAATAAGDTLFLAQKTGAIKIIPNGSQQEIARVIDECGNIGKKRLSSNVIDGCGEYMHSISWEKQAEKTVCVFNEVLNNGEFKL